MSYRVSLGKHDIKQWAMTDRPEGHIWQKINSVCVKPLDLEHEMALTPAPGLMASRFGNCTGCGLHSTII